MFVERSNWQRRPRRCRARGGIPQELALYEPNSNGPANTSLLFNTARWDVLLDSKREPLKASNDPAYTISTIKASFQGVLQALNSARVNGQRYPTAGPELRNVTIIDERADRIFTTFINRFQRPFDKGPIDRYAASGVVVIAPYAFKFSIFSYVKTEIDLLVVAEQAIDALSSPVPVVRQPNDWEDVPAK
jgi:hypothetical protein